MNNKIIVSEIRGRNLVISEKEIIKWLESGYALKFSPLKEKEYWMPIWNNAFELSLRNNACIDEIAYVFGKTKMSISYYMKKHNFPPVIRYLNSYNICNRHHVNEWAKDHNMPLLPEKMDEKYIQMIGSWHCYRIYKEYNLTSE